MLTIIQQALHHFLIARFFAQARLISQGLLNRNRFYTLNRDHFGETIHLPIRHLQNAPDIAHCSFREKGTERDNLTNFVTAIFLLNVLNHLFAAIHAKVDVEVRHRDTLRIEETLEQQRVTQRIKVGDSQRISNERARTRTTPRSHGNAIVFRPLDKIRNDQEITWKAHAFDDPKLEVEARLVFFHRHRMGNHGEALLQALVGDAAQFGNLIVGKFR